MKIISSLKITCCCLVLLLISSSTSFAKSAADDIKSAAAFSEGLCAIIGCGDDSDPALAAEMASGGKILVHGIALNDADLARARQAISAAKMDGFASVEKIQINPLPYRDNLVNLLVIPNPTAANSAGFSKAEAMRVLAPKGKLCMKSGAKWVVETKPLPKDMDEWTHDCHGPDGSYVSNDKVLKFPLGYRWNAGLPMNINNPKLSSSTWSNTGGLVVADGRCFTITSSVIENVPAASFLEYGADQYVVARDAFNGVLLWKKKIGPTFYGGLYYVNRAPFASVSDRVYVASVDGKVLALNSATGEVALTFDTGYPAGRLLVDNGVLAVATWKNGISLGGLFGVDRRRMDFAVDMGNIEAFDISTGKMTWKSEKLATSMRSAGGILYVVLREGADKCEEIGLDPKRKKEDKTEIPKRSPQSIAAYELKTGKLLWSVPSSTLGSDDYLRVDTAGKDAVVVLQDTGKESYVLSAKDGKLISKGPGMHAEFVDIGGTKVDLKGNGSVSYRLGKPFCTPNYFVNNIIVGNRGGNFTVDGKGVSFLGARGGCLVGSTPAFGLLYTTQNWCNCVQAQIDGMIALGSISSEATVAEMEKLPAMEKGEAYQPSKTAKSIATGDWPMYRGNADRSSSVNCDAPKNLDTVWTAQLTEPLTDSMIAMDWKEQLTDPITPPSVSGDIVVSAISDRNLVVALDTATGKEKWRIAVGGRIDTSPSLSNGLCLFGSHDGYLYSVNCDNGKLAWRARVAPREERLVSYAKVESPWPVIGTVLISDGNAYACAGKSQGADGGLLVKAFDPVTGSSKWSKPLSGSKILEDKKNYHVTDMLIKTGNALQLTNVRLDSTTGQYLENPTLEMLKYQAKVNDLKKKGKDGSELKPPEKKEIAPMAGNMGFICSNWTQLGTRKYGNLKLGSIQGSQISWNDKKAASIQGGRIALYPFEKVKPAGENMDPKDIQWQKILPTGYQATSAVLCSDSLIIAGGVFIKADMKKKSFVQIYSLEKGDLLTERVFETPLAYNGIALAASKIYASFEDGSIACLGK